MKPSQLASQLRRIAAAIDNSRNPDRTLVARDLKKVLVAIRVSSSGPWQVAYATRSDFNSKLNGPFIEVEYIDWLSYLQQSDDNAVVIKTTANPIVAITNAGAGSFSAVEIGPGFDFDNLRPQDFDGPYDFSPSGGYVDFVEAFLK